MRRNVRCMAFCLTLVIVLCSAAGAAALNQLSVGLLSQGSYGEEVTQLQNVLAELGLFTDVVDGVYDAGTIEAVKGLQRLLGVRADGIFGPKTQQNYNEVVAAGRGDSLRVAESAVVDDASLKDAVIGIDPGHQKNPDNTLEQMDPTDAARTKPRMSAGAVGVKTGTEEYKITLLVANKLKTMLEDAGAVVVLTRTSHDISLSNQERAQMMNDEEVDVWVRLHCDAANSATQSGARVLIPSRSNNASIYKESLRLGKAVLEAFCGVTGAKKRTIVARTDQAGFNWSKIPVIAIEMGYLSNANDDVKLNRDSYQTACAQGIYNGLAAYFTR